MNNIMGWRCALTLGLLLAVMTASASCDWPAWQQFKQHYISDEGRVIDTSDPRKITTSEGQSYGLFFALVANDRQSFDQLLTWTRNNLAAGDLTTTLPAWLWGRHEDSQWRVLDSNTASDSDVWIAWALLEAGRLWKNDGYTTQGRALLDLIARKEVVKIPGLGEMLLPGAQGFAHDNRWRLNPSYLPPQVIARFARYPGPWKAMRKPMMRLLLETAPKGFSPDWVSWQKGSGWQMQDQPALTGSYNAIRVYLWVGMLSDRSPDKARLLNHFQPMVAATEQRGAPPEKIDTVTGKLTNDGPVGFSAAMLPVLQESPALYVQRQRLAKNFPDHESYYSFVLTLFGQGWDQQRFRFNAQGELVPDWERICADPR
jgi:endo-1,4-beta-D-glucanase Y